MKRFAQLTGLILQGRSDREDRAGLLFGLLRILK